MTRKNKKQENKKETKNTIKHTVTQKDLDINKGALEKAGIKKGDKINLPKFVTLTATRNTKLADGTFVKKGEKVEVTTEYAGRVKRENNKNFKKF